MALIPIQLNFFIWLISKKQIPLSITASLSISKTSHKAEEPQHD